MVHHAVAGEGLQDLGVGRDLLVDGRGGPTVEEEEFRANEPGALRPGLPCRGQVRGATDVGGELDAVARSDSSRSSVSSARRLSSVRARSSTSAIRSSSGSTTTEPSRPSIATVVPLSTAATMPSQPTTAGMPSDRARMAAWLVGDPVPVTIPTMRSRGRPAVWLGVRSVATITDGSAGTGGAKGRPCSRATTRSRTSSMSATRAARYSEEEAARRDRNVAKASVTACSADEPLSMASPASLATWGSPANMAWASKMSASSWPTDCASWSARSSSCCSASARAVARRSRSAPASPPWVSG